MSSPKRPTKEESQMSGLGRQSSANLKRASNQPIDLPKMIGRFQIESFIGQGGCAKVYLGYDKEMDRRVAIKIPILEAADLQSRIDRFLREARLAGGISHPNVCPIYEVGENSKSPFIVMPFIQGQNLRQFLDSRSVPLSLKQSWSLIRRIASGVEAAHRKEIIHRDLKPDNIIIDYERKEPIVMDFGLAKLSTHEGTQQTQAGKILGTPSYMAPEQALAQHHYICPATDIYSLSVIFFEVLVGRLPFQGKPMEVLGMHLQAPRPRISEYRAEYASLDDCIASAMAIKIQDRPVNIATFVKRIEQAILKVESVPIQIEAKAEEVDNASRNFFEEIQSIAHVHQEVVKEAKVRTKVLNGYRTRSILLLTSLIILSVLLIQKYKADDIPEIPKNQSKEVVQKKAESVIINQLVKVQSPIKAESPQKVEDASLQKITVNPTLNSQPKFFLPYDFKGVPFEWRQEKHRAKLNTHYQMSEFKPMVDKGVKWICTQQNGDGSWRYPISNLAESVRYSNDTISATAFCCLVLLAQEDANTFQLRSGLEYLISRQETDGRFKDTKGKEVLSYSHAIATIALAESAAIFQNRGGDSRYFKAASLAISSMERGQSTNGSWGYTSKGESGDTSIFGWHVQALRAAKLAAIPINPKTFNKSAEFLKTVWNPTTNTYGYRDPNTDRPTLTAIGITSKRILRGSKSDDSSRSFQFHSLKLSKEEIHNNCYSIYYLTECFRVGPIEDWKNYKKEYLAPMSKMQLQNGSWPADKSETGKVVGDLGTTCLHLLSLQVAYRYPEIENVSK